MTNALAQAFRTEHTVGFSLNSLFLLVTLGILIAVVGLGITGSGRVVALVVAAVLWLVLLVALLV